MLPVARTALRRIGNGADVVTFISHYTRGRFASAFGPRGGAGTPAARGGHRPVRARLRSRAPRCGRATGWATAPSSCACRGWCRARVRTC